MSTRWVEGVSPKSKILAELAFSITDAETDSNWILHYPSRVSEVMDIFVIKRSMENEDVFIEFYLPNKVSLVLGNDTDKTNNYYMECRFGTRYLIPTDENDRGDFEEDCGSLISRFSWFRSDSKSNIKSWLPIKYWMSVNEDRIVMVMQGDPSANYHDGIMSFGYFGAITPYTNSKVIRNNFGMTVSSDVSPYNYQTEESLKQYSDLTGTGVVDFTMLETSTGFPFQSHFVAFTTPDEFMNKKFDGPSRYTKGYQFSKINICHGYEGYRGSLSGVTVGDSSALTAFEEVARYEPLEDIDKTYQVFLINAPYSILNNGPNVLYAISVLKNEGELILTNGIQITPASQTVVATSKAVFKATVGDMDITNLTASVWDINNPEYSISKGIVNTSVNEKDSVVSILWKGITASAQLIVKPATLTIHPDVLLVDVGTENLVYTALFGEQDVTDQVIWSSDNPDIVMDNNQIPSMLKSGVANITATYNSETHSLMGYAKLTVKDQIFTVTPTNPRIQIDGISQFKAMLGTKEVTQYCVWSISGNSLNTIDKTGKSGAWKELGAFDVEVHLTIADKTALVAIQVVDDRILLITPSNTTVQPGDTVQYKATLDGLDVSTICTWAITSPHSIDLDGTASNLETIGTNTVTATYVRTNKVATTSLVIRDDRILSIVPSNFVANINTQVQYRAMLGTIDVTSDCVWSILNSNYTLDSNEQTGVLSVTGTATVSAYYAGSNKNVTTGLTVVDNRYFGVAPMSVDNATPLQFTAMLDDLNVSSRCIWTITSPWIIDSNGYVSNTTRSGSGQVTAYDTITGRSATTHFEIKAKLNINHDFDFACIMDWPSTSKADLDLYATWESKYTNLGLITGGQIWYGYKEVDQIGDLGKVYLDHDNTRNSITGSSTDPSMTETISIKGMFEVPIIISVKNYNGASIGGTIHLNVYDNTGTIIKTFTFSTVKAICTITSHADGTYTIV